MGAAELVFGVLMGICALYLLVDLIHGIVNEKKKSKLSEVIERERNLPTASTPRELPKLTVSEYSNATLKDRQGNVIVDMGSGTVFTKTYSDGSVSQKFIKDGEEGGSKDD